MEQARQADAAWYPDPTGAAELRWWDGATWTEHVHPVSDGGAVHPLEILRDDRMWAPWPDAPGPVPELVAGSRSANPTGRQVLVFLGIAVVAVICFVITPWLFGACVVAGIGWLLVWHRRNGQVIVDAFDEWCRERGLRYVGGRVMDLYSGAPLAPERLARLEPVLATLRRSPVASKCAQVEGRIWAGVPGPCRITEVRDTTGGGDEKVADGYLVVELPLPAAVAGRYPGLFLTASAGMPRMVDGLVGAQVPRGWRSVDHEASRGRRAVQAFAHPDQDELAAWELLDPAFLLRLEEWFAARGTASWIESLGTQAWIVLVDGAMSVVSRSSFGFYGIGEARAASAGHLEGRSGHSNNPGILHAHLESIGDLYRRVFAEFQ